MERKNLNANPDLLLGQGICCFWEPGYIPNDGSLAWERILELAFSDTLEECGFDQTVTIMQFGDKRSLELLGPDSPGELVFEYTPVKRDGSLESMEEQRLLAIRMIEWVQERRRIM